MNILDLLEEAYRRRFLELRKKPGTRPQAILQRMKVNTMRWLKPTMRNSQQIVNMVVTEQLVVTLGAAQKNRVIRHQPKTLENVVMLLEAYNMAEDSTISGGAAIGEKSKPQVQVIYMGPPTTSLGQLQWMEETRPSQNAWKKQEESYFICHSPGARIRQQR
ncbi:hypothetical protein JRQ81_012660 [Phrynocephalus forsythii]|uniref:SCAN box domain-containing protein n=1 Tax=Phrynocephalus forsythii TaxID=171643 RepID=A0A9Q0Y284_9SAUR|nr:hypothetical protein JRQ81_012660 [Phrynocephalus forsythii]